MDLPSLILASLLFFMVAYSYGLNCIISQKKSPNRAPIGLPIFKNLFDIGSKQHESLANLAKKHGPLMTITLGSVTTIVVSSQKMAREVLQRRDEAFSGRQVPDSIVELEHNNHVIAWISIGMGIIYV